MSPLRFSKLKVLSDELVPSATPPEAEGKPSRALSDLDNSIFVIGYYGGGVASSETVDIPLLRLALSDALAKLPWFAGRFVMRQDGRLDVSCTNAGARLVVASTSSTLADLAGAISTQGPGYLQQLPFPFSSMLPVNHPTWVVKRKAPLLFVFVLHLSGGGHMLWLLLHHATADFTTLQALAGAVSEAHRQRMQVKDREQSQQQQEQQTQEQRGRAASLSLEVAAGRGSCGNAEGASTMPEAAAATAAEREALGPSAQQGQDAAVEGQAHMLPPRFAMCAADVEAHADASPYPPGVPDRDDFIAADWLALVKVVWNALYRMLFLGGGVQLRQVLVPSSLLADLKRRANQELEQQQQQGEGVQEGLQMSGEQVEDSRVEEEGPGGGAKQQQAGQAQGALRASAGVRWVSTNDALVARAMQVLHSLPLRRHLPFNVTVAGEMRRRLQPPLPAGAGQLGNLSYAVRVMDTWPADTSLGRMAAVVRYALTDWLTPQFVRCMAAAVRHVSRGGVTSVTSPMAVSSDPLRNVFSPTGPITVSNWDVDYGCWQLGRAPPLCFTPLLTLSPGVIIVHPSSPHQREQQRQQQQGQDAKRAGMTAAGGDTSVTAGADAGSCGGAGGGAGGGSGAGVCKGDKAGGVVLTLWLHNVAWRQLDALGCSFGQLLKLEEVQK